MPARPDAVANVVTLLHPGEMGAAVGACLRLAGWRVLWVGAGRSTATRERAGAAGLEQTSSLCAALAASEVALAVCPPHAALALAQTVVEAGFRGTYIDANAVSPGTTRAICGRVEAGGARFVDGGIIGPAPTGEASARLYLSGPDAERLAPRLSGGGLRAIALAGPRDAASTLKVCYAGWNKNAIALLACVRALASRAGVEDALLGELQATQPGAVNQMQRIRGAARRAWRWEGEMRESADAFVDAGLPAGFSRAAAETYARLAEFKDVAEPPPLAAILGAIAGEPRRPREPKRVKKTTG